MNINVTYALLTTVTWMDIKPQLAGDGPFCNAAPILWHDFPEDNRNTECLELIVLELKTPCLKLY